jgi:hypothetical protein
MRKIAGGVVSVLLSALVGAGCASTSPKFGQPRAPGVVASGEPPALECKNEKQDGGVLVSEERAQARRGYNDHKFSDR